MNPRRTRSNLPGASSAEPPGLLSRLLHSRRFRLFVLAFVVLLTAGLAWLIWPYWQLSGKFDEQVVDQPSRLYASPTVLRVDEPFSPKQVVAELGASGYRELGVEPQPTEGAAGTEGEAGGQEGAESEEEAAPAPPRRPQELLPGTFRRADGVLAVHLRRHPTIDGFLDAAVLEIRHNGSRVQGLTLGGEEMPSAQLEPVLLESFYGDDLQERRPVSLEQVPEELIWAVQAAEDESFFRHGGLSVPGIVRAAWVNARGGEVSQGGSTLTQQLVKNLYLTSERTFSRKAREAVLATLLEVRHSKEEILQAYLNEIYLGASNGVSIMGVGAASRAYFGKNVEELDLAEAATLAGMIQTPARYMPTRDPEASKGRRDWVLGRMAEARFIPGERAEAAQAEPLDPDPIPVVRRYAPYFAEFTVEEATRRFGVSDLDGIGYQLFSTLRWADQNDAQEAVAWGVDALENGWEKSRKGQGEPLQAALVSVDPHTGGVLAYIGGRDYGQSQFDRAGDALRQAGSAFKPVIYAAAFEDGNAYPAAFVEDAPLTVRQAGSDPWTPRNSGGGYSGWVTVRQAVERSLNVATARVALQEGLGRVVQVARDLGVETPLEPVPAIALGAFEVTPVQLATVYATFAAGGRRPPVHALEGIVDPLGIPVDGVALPAAEPVISPETAYLVTSVLQGVLNRGTAAGARRQGLDGPLAGKTGTTNDRRDSWFAGYSPDRVSVVWVGYDDNRKTQLSGARAALPIWTRFMVGVEPRGGYPVFTQPAGIATAVIDPTTGELASEYCPTTVTEVYPTGKVPYEQCHVHDGYDDWRERWERWNDERYDRNGDEIRDRGYDDRPDPRQRTQPEPNRFRRWLNDVFGEDDDGN